GRGPGAIVRAMRFAGLVPCAVLITGCAGPGGGEAVPVDCAKLLTPADVEKACGATGTTLASHPIADRDLHLVAETARSGSVCWIKSADRTPLELSAWDFGLGDPARDFLARERKTGDLI